MVEKVEQIRFLGLREVCRRTSLSQAMIYVLQRKGEFPRSYRLSVCRVGWREQDVDAWLQSREETVPTGGKGSE